MRKRSLRPKKEVSHIHVRSLEIGDFAFVQDLASKQPTFTVPPTYVLWLMLRIKGAICLIAEHSNGHPAAYLIAVPVKGPAESLFIWQLASSKGSQQQRATLTILRELRNTVLKLGTERIMFSTVPNSPTHRAIRRYAHTVVATVPTVLGTLPPSVGLKESEFLLSLKD